MVRELHAKLKKDGNTTTVKMRFVGRYIYLKSNNSNYAQQIIGQMRDKGALIESGKSSWIRIDIFGDKKIVKLAGIEYDMGVVEDGTLEEGLQSFYTHQYLKAGFKVRDCI